LVAGQSDEQITAEQHQLHLGLRKLVASAPVVQSIWIYDPSGVPLATSWTDPPPLQSFSDRDFFQAHLSPGTGLYYGKVYASALDAQPYFTVSRRLQSAGTFIGVLEVSVLPSNFVRFFSTLAYTQGLQYALIRNDGAFLARYPEGPAGAPDSLDEHTNFRRTIARNANGGLYTSTSPIDEIERRFGVRHFANTPIYLSAGIASSTIRSEWISEMASHLIFGVPATLLLFLTLLAVLKRTRRLYEEVDRRLAAEDGLALHVGLHHEFIVQASVHAWNRGGPNGGRQCPHRVGSAVREDGGIARLELDPDVVADFEQAPTGRHDVKRSPTGSFRRMCGCPLRAKAAHLLKFRTYSQQGSKLVKNLHLVHSRPRIEASRKSI
jgi:hypothetical protein